MIIECHSCHARFRLDATKIRGKGARVRCRRCGDSTIVLLEGRQEEAVPPATGEGGFLDLGSVVRDSLAEPPAGPPPGTVELRARVWYNPDLRSQSYYVPGVIAILTMLTSLLLTSMAIVREREIGTMEQLLVSPIRPAELILGKTLPFALIGFLDVALITVVAVFWFAVP